MGVHVDERDRWGIDNHTRRCIEATLSHVPELRGDRHKKKEMIDQCLLREVNALPERNWDILRAVTALKEREEAQGDSCQAHIVRGCHALERAIVEVDDSKEGRMHFRVHPKGTGIVCKRPGGLPTGTFISDYLGELYPPWRFYERQDAWKKVDKRSTLPDIYNITMDRPRQEERGYDAVFVEASNKAGFASRISHSCDPNCHVVRSVRGFCGLGTMRCTPTEEREEKLERMKKRKAFGSVQVSQSIGGKLTLGMYTKKHVREGEELSWDYALVTEDARELRNATCLCSAEACRGLFLLYGGDTNLNAFFRRELDLSSRTAMLCIACVESLTKADIDRLNRNGVKSCMLTDVHGRRIPEWLEKWTALVLDFCEREQEALRRNHGR